MSDVVHTTEAGVKVYRSRWGYHPCPYETFLKLKKLSAAYWEAVGRAASWKRWHRKAPHNRVARRKIRDELGRKVGSEVIGPMPEPNISGPFLNDRTVIRYGESFRTVTADDMGVLAALCRARYPSGSPSDVRALAVSNMEIDELIEKLQ